MVHGREVRFPAIRGLACLAQVLSVLQKVLPQRAAHGSGPSVDLPLYYQAFHPKPVASMGSIGDDPMKPLEGKNVLVTGGTGSLGRVLVRRLLAGEMGQPKQVLVFARDETKQHYMRLQYAHRPVETVVGISTDKACKPVNVMGMTKALQERILLGANLDCPETRFVCVRYGNVISSRGSVVPLFLEQIKQGGPVTITVKEMTRFLLTLDQAVDTIFAALRNALPGETYVPKVPSARMLDIATILIGSSDVNITYTGIRPGEKIHEILVSEEECHRTLERDGYFVIEPILQEIRHADVARPALAEEYSSAKALLPMDRLRKLIDPYLEVADPEEPT